jgi:hypothetical protein
MTPRRANQLERAAKLRANVSVLLGDVGGAPDVFELANVKRTSLERATRIWVQVISWHDPEPYAQIVVRDNGTQGTKEDDLPTSSTVRSTSSRSARRVRPQPDRRHAGTATRRDQGSRRSC